MVCTYWRRTQDKTKDMTKSNARKSLVIVESPAKAKTINRYLGPDFEVKASMAVRGPSHRIHGLTQLEPPESGRLLLFSLQVRNEDGAANSLPAIVRRGQQLAASDLVVAERLEDLLAKAGYSASHEAEYEKLRLRIVAEGLYRVSDDFPRLVRTSFPGGVPGGVDGIDYDINLGGFGHLLVASRATDPFPV